MRLRSYVSRAKPSNPGLIDWLSLNDPKVVKIANWHARLNVIALLIFAVSFYLARLAEQIWWAGVTLLPWRYLCSASSWSRYQAIWEVRWSSNML